MQSERVLRPVPLDATHDIDSFDCGIGRLNEYLSRLALADQTSAKTRTYVLVEDARVIAYYSVSPGVVEAALTRGSIERRQRRQVIPVVVLARLAVDGAWQSCGVGRDLLRSVAQQGASAAGVIGALAVVATVTGEEARSFFRQNGFASFPGDAYRLYVPLAVTRAGVSGGVSE
jgi:GNAT superfamily N-acetyltransferase